MVRRQDIGVLLFYYVGYSRMRNMALRLKHEPVARFVTFHDIPPEALECFKANLHFLKRNTNVVSLDDFFLNRLLWEKINIVITFDDGYKSWVSEAVPILRKLGLPATFFVSSGFVGFSKEDRTEAIRSKQILKNDTRRIKALSFKDVRRIAEEGFIIGGHTLNHRNLADLRDEIQMRYEIAEDKKRLESITGKKIEYFAYPMGGYQNPALNIPEMLKGLGYRGAVTTKSGFNSLGANPYLLHRELTGAFMGERVFKARVYGNYDGVQFLKKQIRKIFGAVDRMENSPR